MRATGALGHGSRMPDDERWLCIEWSTFMASAAGSGSIGIRAVSRWYLAFTQSVYRSTAILMSGISASYAMISRSKISHLGYSEPMMITLLTNSSLSLFHCWRCAQLASLYRDYGCTANAPAGSVERLLAVLTGLCGTIKNSRPFRLSCCSILRKHYVFQNFNVGFHRY